MIMFLHSKTYLFVLFISFCICSCCYVIDYVFFLCVSRVRCAFKSKVQPVTLDCQHHKLDTNTIWWVRAIQQTTAKTSKIDLVCHGVKQVIKASLIGVFQKSPIKVTTIHNPMVSKKETASHVTANHQV